MCLSSLKQSGLPRTLSTTFSADSMGKLLSGFHTPTLSTRLRYLVIAVFSLTLGIWLHGTLASVFAIHYLAFEAPEAPIPNQHVSPATLYDAIIVGGGPSGLSALSGLARMRRNVLMIDSGTYRNDPTRRMHDILGFDGVPPAYFRHIARAQIAHYNTATMVNGTVTAISPVSATLDRDEDDSSSFPTDPTYPTYPTLFSVVAHLDLPSQKLENQTLYARKIILATGLRDILPSTPGVAEAWGKGIFWCPWCDGHEYAHQPLGILAPLPKVPGLVREIHTLNGDMVAFVNGTDTPEQRAQAEAEHPGWAAYLASRNISVENRPVARLVRLGGDEEAFKDEEWRQFDMLGLPSVAHRDRFRVEFSGDGDGYVERAAFLANFPTEQASPVGPDMGVELVGGRMEVNNKEGLLTNVPGVYAVGDANSDNVTNIPHALFSGKRAAVFLHMALEEENEENEKRPNVMRSVEKMGLESTQGLVKRHEKLDVRDVWHLMNGEPESPLYAR
ncbi:FAD/NAD(P)-binding domain-containing protein [Sodiomyces alkalinus F11]|uniref:FAD/NAD(P)-binding domain-containing protein n=1 Tax=Sodiomyces alkalinus (strain CBS 110278 / VKM F-3762 / F11) TaxID=1314773 RepID=A0A3N2Q730_SODAK|nr:FAD/NAD(P)-binding domain-containing protein [Sodiomyces alkalinus F11]ROT42593.1 FAD/NAD(P)-binding domain-containing protein [Sodiomyces alkalinus F11]